MTNHTLQNSTANPSEAKRERILAAVVEEVVISDDDSSVVGGMDICHIIENSTNGSRQTENSCALQALAETIRNTLLEINEIRERNRERRHRDLLQILKKMVQQENVAKDEGNDSIKNFNNDALNEDQHSSTCEYDVEHDCVKKYFSNADGVASSSSNSATAFRNRSDQNEMGSPSTFTSSSPKEIQVLHKSDRNNEHTEKMKNVIAVNRDDTKSEFQKMRAKMLELQRQKMEDRERKKLKFTQTQNI